MAVPKRKVSKARRDKRRSSHWKLETPGIVTCPKCGAYRLPPFFFFKKFLFTKRGADVLCVLKREIRAPCCSLHLGQQGLQLLPW